MIRKETLGVVLAGGKSTRTLSIGVKQKALAIVKWEGQEVPLVVHQIRMLKKVTDDVCVVVGWMKEDVQTILRAYDIDCMVFVDNRIEGIGMIWKQLASKYGNRYKKLISVNCDDLHSFKDMLRLDANGVSVKNTDDVNLIATKTVYDVDNGHVFGVKGKNPSEHGNSVYVGTGMYVFNMQKLNECFFGLESNGECNPDGIVEQMIKKNEELSVYIVRDWLDCGDAKILKNKMVGYGFQ